MPTNEIMIVNPTIRELISEERGRQDQLDAIQIGYLRGWWTSPRTCGSSWSAADVDKATALEFAPNPEQLKMALKGIKVAASGILS